MNVERRRILIIGGDNGGGSAGDQIMCEAACDFFVKAGWSVITDTQSERWRSPIKNVAVVKQIRKDDYSGIFGRIITSLLKLYRIFLLPYIIRSKRNVPLLLHGNAFKSAMQSVDFVLFAGCGGITDKYPINLCVWRSIVICAKRLNIPVYMSGIGVGPLENILLRKLAKSFISIPEYITVREKQYSMKILSELGRSLNVRAVPDDAYFYIPRGKELGQVCEFWSSVDSKKKTIGVNVMSRIFQNQEQVQCFASILKTFFPAEIYNVLLIAVTQEDAEVLKDISQIVTHSIVVEKREPSFMKLLIGKLDLMLSARYHGCIFALCAQVPTIGLYSERYWKDKIDGAFDYVGELNYSFSLNEFIDNSASIVESIMAEHESIKEKIKRGNERLKPLSFFVHNLILNKQ